MSKTHFSALSSFILLSLYSTSVLAANDWAKPCFNGTCSYDLPDNPSGSSGTLKIWGSNTAIADITTAGGWEIIGCDPNKQEQDIRIVCKGIDMDGDGDNDGCSHLFAHGPGNSSGTNTTASRPVPTGTVADLANNSTSTDEDHRAVGKIVRLPEECGSQAFGRIANAWTHENQTVPSHISKRLAPLHRRTQPYHKVKGLTIDTQFHKSNSAQHGSVSFAIVGANVPGAKTSNPSTVPSLKTSGHSGKRSFVHSRVFSQRRGFGDIIHHAGDAIGDAAGTVGNAISDGAGAVGGAIGDGVDAVGDAISGTKSFNNSISTPLDISKTFTLFDQSITCTDKFTLPGINGSTINPTVTASGQMKVDVEAGIKGTITIGVAASGSLTDLRVDSFEMSTKLDADVTGAIVMSAGVGGSIDSGKIKFFELGIPGFDFPGIFSIGPTFQINGQTKVSLNVDTQMRVGVVYHIGDLEFDFPDGGKKSGTFNPGDTPLQLSAVPTAKATGKVEAHLIPSLNVGINAFGGVAKAEIFANLDASATMTLTEDVTLPSVKANVTLREERPAVEIVRPVIRGRGAIGAYYLKKRSPAPEPSGLEDIVEAIEKASEAIVDGVKELKDIMENPNPLSPIPAPTESSPSDSPNAPPPVTPTGTEGAPADPPHSSAPNTLAPTGKPSADSPNSPSPATPAPAGSSPADSTHTLVPETPAPTGSSPADSPNSPPSAVPVITKSTPAHSPNSSSAQPTPTKSSPVDSTNTPGPAIDLQSPSGPSASSFSAIPTATKDSTTNAPKSSSMTIETAAVSGSSHTVTPNTSAVVATTAAESSPTIAPIPSSSAMETAAGSSSAAPLSVTPTPALSSTATATGSSTSASPKPSDSLTVNDDVGFGGCLEFDAGLNANVGADADFFGLFNPSKTIPLFTKQYTLYKKCWGDKSKRRSMPDISSRRAALVGRDLQCNAGNSSSSGLQKLADEIVSALSIF